MNGLAAEGDTPTLARVIGENVRRLREEQELTQDELVSRWRSVGLAWPRTKLSVLESGARKSVPLGDALLMAIALDVNLAVLLEGDGRVRLATDAVPVPLTLLRGWLSGECETDALRERAVQGTTHTGGASSIERDMATRVEVLASDVQDMAQSLWGRTLRDERDRRVGELSASSMAERRAHRGHVTRQLESEIRRGFARRAMGYGGE